MVIVEFSFNDPYNLPFDAGEGVRVGLVGWEKFPPQY
jgi:hypothetical protein